MTWGQWQVTNRLSHSTAFCGGYSGVRISNNCIVVNMLGSGSDRVWRESGVRRSVLCSCVWHRENMFMFYLTYYTLKKHKLYISNAFFIDNGTLNVITVQHKKLQSRQL
jgi:hypothetical protein